MTDGQCVADTDSNTEIKGKVLHVHVYYNHKINSLIMNLTCIKIVFMHVYKILQNY